MPLNQVKQEKEVGLAHLIDIVVLYHVCQSVNSYPSPDQSGHGVCTSIATPMWTLDPRARQIINEACALFGFNPLPVLYGVRARVLFSFFNHAHVSEDAT